MYCCRLWIPVICIQMCILQELCRMFLVCLACSTWWHVIQQHFWTKLSLQIFTILPLRYTLCNELKHGVGKKALFSLFLSTRRWTASYKQRLHLHRKLWFQNPYEIRSNCRKTSSWTSWDHELEDLKLSLYVVVFEVNCQLEPKVNSQQRLV